MATFTAANNAHTTLAGPVASTATSITLAAGTGALFPAPTGSQIFTLTLSSQLNQSTREIVYCTARSGDVCTVTRGQEGTAPLTFNSGDFVDNDLTAGTLQSFVSQTQLQQQAGNYAADTGTPNNIVASVTPAPVSLSQIIGAPLRILIANTNTGNTVFTLNALPATSVLNTDGSQLNPGQICASGVAEIVFNGTNYQLLTSDLLPLNNNWTGTTNTFSGIVASVATMNNTTFSNGQVTANLIVANDLTSTGGSIGGVSLPGGGAINTNGAVSVSNTLLATTLRAATGATGSGDIYRVSILDDFPLSTFNNQQIYQRLPSGFIIQASEGSSVTGNADFVTFYSPFPNTCVQVIASESNPSGGWPGGRVTVFGTQLAPNPNMGFYIYTYAWATSSTSWSPSGAIGFRYIALGY